MGTKNHAAVTMVARIGMDINQGKRRRGMLIVTLSWSEVVSMILEVFKLLSQLEGFSNNKDSDRVDGGVFSGGGAKDTLAFWLLNSIRSPLLLRSVSKLVTIWVMLLGRLLGFFCRLCMTTSARTWGVSGRLCSSGIGSELRMAFSSAPIPSTLNGVCPARVS